MPTASVVGGPRSWQIPQAIHNDGGAAAAAALGLAHTRPAEAQWRV
ncbi:MAG: hypothetical protein ACKV0T_21845 [Planctomycetales bacterium]